MELTNEWFNETQKTPPEKRSKDVFHHQIFFAETVPGRRLRGDARERTRLSPDAQRRWDFFFRPDLSALDEVDAEELKAIESLTGARGAALRIYLIALPVIALAAAGAAAAFGMQAGVVAFLVLFLSATFGFGFVYSKTKLSGRQDAILAFRREIRAGIDAIAANRPEEHEMRAFFAKALDASADRVRDVILADPSALASFTGWTAMSPAIDLLSSTQHRRAFARAGTLFAITDVMLVYVQDDRLHVNRYAFDMIADDAIALDEWSLRRDGINVGRRTRRRDLPEFPIANAPAPRETNAETPLLPSIPIVELAVRELVIAAPSGAIEHRLADPQLFADISDAQDRALKLLERLEGRLTELAGQAEAASIDLALENSKRKVRWERLTADLQAIHEERQTMSQDAAIDALRRIVYADDAAKAQAAKALAAAPSAPASAAEPTQPSKPAAPKKPLHDLY